MHTAFFLRFIFNASSVLYELCFLGMELNTQMHQQSTADQHSPGTDAAEHSGPAGVNIKKEKEFESKTKNAARPTKAKVKRSACLKTFFCKMSLGVPRCVLQHATELVL